MDKKTSSYIIESVELSDGTVFPYATKKSLKNLIGLDSIDGYVEKFSDPSRLTSGATNYRTVEIMSASATLTVEGGLDCAQAFNGDFYPKLQALGTGGYIDFRVKDHARNKVSVVRMAEPQVNDGNSLSFSDGDVEINFTGQSLRKIDL